MVGLPDGEKKFDDIFSRFDRIHACDRQMDGQTDIPMTMVIYALCIVSRGKNHTTTDHSAIG